MTVAPILLAIAVLFGGCSVRFDTNGYYSKRTSDGPLMCSENLSPNSIYFRPCN